VLALDAHPHAHAVLGAALSDTPAHAYLLHGPAGTGKREAARAFAAELLAKDARDPESARTRTLHGTHPDLTWVAPSGAHEMLRRDVDEAVVAAAAHTPFEATHRVFVLERADTMNDEAANSLLKTLEEPPAYVVLLLLTDKPTQVLPTIASRCQPVRFDPLPAERLAQSLKGIPEETATACARLSLGDGEKARQLAYGDGPRLRGAAEELARAPLHKTVAQSRPWRAIIEQARARGAAVRDALASELREELEFLPKKEHKRRTTEYEERARRADRRATTEALDHALQLAGLWYRDLACVQAGAPELVFHADRTEQLQQDAQTAQRLIRAQELVDDTRARLILNVSEELACEALAYRLEETLS
jgi:DNA polymerase-3 subunit delta'